ncbi:hypothetical protein F4778DRAFT_544482 [Xylariomycetidae sp. FL2044]|nr:hypothetical protein F4778DRAFT_544482 [Xylariomycetidae sp. FL2044]
MEATRKHEAPIGSIEINITRAPIPDDSGSSSEDDEGIPSTTRNMSKSPRKRNRGNNILPASSDPFRSPKRRYSDAHRFFPLKTKRLRLSDHPPEILSPRPDVYPTPDSFGIAQPLGDIASSRGSTSSSKYEPVPEDLVNALNSTIQHNITSRCHNLPDPVYLSLDDEHIPKLHQSVEGTEEPGTERQELGGSQASDEDVEEEDEDMEEEDENVDGEDDEGDGEDENVDGEEDEGDGEGKEVEGKESEKITPQTHENNDSSDEELFVRQDDPELIPSLKGTISQIPSMPKDPYEVPDSPPQRTISPDAKRRTSPTVSMEPETSSQGSQGPNRQHPRSKQRLSQPDKATATASAYDEGSEEEESASNYSDDSARNHNQAEENGHRDGLGGDSQILADVDLSVEESFARDAEDYRSRRIHSEEAFDMFEAPAEDDLLAIHLDYKPFQAVVKLLRHDAWTGLPYDWQWRSFDFDTPNTQSGLEITLLLLKMERLFEAAPKAPRIRDQNLFFQENRDLLSHYIYQVQLIVEHIRTERIASLQRNRSSLNSDVEKREEMAQELVDLIIPFLLHTLASAWSMGGRLWFETQFTRSTIELHSRVIGWVLRLYRPLLRELKRKPLGRAPNSVYQKSMWRKRNDKRLELEPLLGDLFSVIKGGLDKLAEEEVREKQAVQDRRRWVERLEKMEAERRQDREARRQQIRERQYRSLMSIRGIIVPPGPIRFAEPSSTSSWSDEEERFLMNALQRSYPVVPDLRPLELEVTKSIEEMEEKVPIYLESMLRHAYPQRSAQVRAMELEKMMRNYRAKYNRSG